MKPSEQSNVHIFVDVDPNAPHDEDCGFWHGFACRCKPEMEAALYREHCHECDFLHGSGYNRCNCLGKCICDRPETVRKAAWVKPGDVVVIDGPGICGRDSQDR